MKFTKVLLFVILLLSFSSDLYAQMPMGPMREMHEEMHGGTGEMAEELQATLPLRGARIDFSDLIPKKGNIDFLLSPAMVEKLELTEEQLNSLKTLKKDSTKDKIKKRADIEIAEVDLKALLDADQPDLGKIQEKMREIANLKADLHYIDIETYEKAKTLLNLEQKAKLKELPMRKTEGAKPGEKPKPKEELKPHH